MRIKLGFIAAITGLLLLAPGLSISGLSAHGIWLWLPGLLLLAAGTAALLWPRLKSAVAEASSAQAQPIVGMNTARLLDNFEQRFAELKGRKPNADVLGDLYALAGQLEQRGRVPQATAVYRHLVRLDNTYRDAAARLRRLVDAERISGRTSALPARVAAAPANTGARPAATDPAPRTTGTAAAAAQPAKAAAPPAAPPAPRNAAAPGAKSAARAASPSNPPAVAPGAAAAAPTTAPEQLGRYRLEREIGRGAMGVVYLGRDTAINRAVAIKAIPLASEFSDAELAEARSRFFREAETAGRLNHPYIVTIYDVGEERGLAYIAMEYLKGRHLSDYAQSNNLLEPRKVLELTARTAEALGFAHKQQVVHRDIKPANLMYDAASDVLKITDFGIARLTGAGSTRTGIVLGTPSFMSPEQLEGRKVAGSSDLFSLGVSLFQLLTGHLPFSADTMTGLMQQIAETPHPPVRAYRPDLPPCVDAILNRALAKNPDDRFESGAQMAASLADCRNRVAGGTP